MKAKDARVLLTGATGGIGQAAASALVGAGASVMLLGRSPARLAAQARALARTCTGPTPPSIEWYAADLTRTSSLGGISDVAAGWGCNVLVHNAGVPAFGRIEAFAATEMAQVMHLNLFAPMLLTQALLPHLRTRAAPKQHMPAAERCRCGGIFCAVSRLEVRSAMRAT